MLCDTQQNLFLQKIKAISENNELNELIKNEAFRRFLALISAQYAHFMAVAQDEKAQDEKRIRAIEAGKIVESYLNFFEDFKPESAGEDGVF